MYARLESSLPQRAAELPIDFTRLVIEALNEEFGAKLQGREFIATGHIYPEEIHLRVGLKTPGELRQPNFEASIDFSAKANNAVEMLHICADFLQSTILEFFEANEELALPLNWKAFTFKETTIYAQSTMVNTELETEADKFLRDNGFLPDGNDDASIDPFVMARERARNMGEDTGTIEREGNVVGHAKVTTH